MMPVVSLLRPRLAPGSHFVTFATFCSKLNLRAHERNANKRGRLCHAATRPVIGSSRAEQFAFAARSIPTSSPSRALGC